MKETRQPGRIHMDRKYSVCMRIKQAEDLAALVSDLCPVCSLSLLHFHTDGDCANNRIATTKGQTLQDKT